MTKNKLDITNKLDMISTNNFTSTTTLTSNDQMSTQLSVDGPSQNSSDKVYNPYEHRILPLPNTFTGSLIHILKGSLGTGLLAIPRAFMNAGLVVGTLGTICIGILCTYTIHLLVVASQRLCIDMKVPSLGFAETAEAACARGPPQFRRLATFSRLFVEISLTLTHFVGNAVYVVFISESIAKLIGFYHEPALEWGQYFKLIILALLLFFCQIRELKHLVPFSFIANMLMILVLIITGYYMVGDIKHVDPSERKLVNSIELLPTFFTTVIFSMEGIGTIMPVENSMIEDKFIGCPGVLNIAMSMVIVFYTIIGFCGYYAFGEKTMATITQNLPDEDILAQVVQAAISLSIFFTFLLQYYVPMDITWRRIQPHVSKEKQHLVQVIWRALTATFIVGIAAAAGNKLGPLIDLLGAVFFSTLGLFVPTFLDMLVNWGEWGKFKYILIRDFLLLLFFLVGLTSGTYNAILNFIE